MKRKPYTVQEKEILLQSKAIVKIANSSATYLKELKVFAMGKYDEDEEIEVYIV